MNTKPVCYFCKEPVNTAGTCIICQTNFNLYGVFTYNDYELIPCICFIYPINKYSFFRFNLNENVTYIVFTGNRRIVVTNNIIPANALKKFNFYNSFK